MRGAAGPTVRDSTSWYDCLKGVRERRRGSVEKPDCDVARRLAVAMSSEEGTGEIQMPSWSQIRLSGTKCCRRCETKSFIQWDSRCSKIKKHRLRGPLLRRSRTPFSRSNRASRGSLAA